MSGSTAYSVPSMSSFTNSGTASVRAASVAKRRTGASIGSPIPLVRIMLKFSPPARREGRKRAVPS